MTRTMGVLDVIQRHHHGTGYGISLREIMPLAGIRNVAAVWTHVRELRAMDLVRRQDYGQSRIVPVTLGTALVNGRELPIYPPEMLANLSWKVTGPAA